MKRTILFIISLFAACGYGLGQNYVYTLTPRIATNSTSGLTVDNSMRTYQYFDGLGRAQQVVQAGITPGKADLVSYQEYDAFGRESNTWLPAMVASNNGNAVSLAILKTKSSTT